MLCMKTPEADEDSHIGEIIKFGHYMGSELSWQCVDEDKDSLLLVSKEVICQKAFDAAESKTALKGVSDIEKYGDGRWDRSNLREWLNSCENKVCYSTVPPTEKAVWDKDNPYEEEAGFLAGFSKGELGIIMGVCHDGVFDKVFLLSSSEIAYLESKIYEWNKRKIDKISLKKHLPNGQEWWYWLRSPSRLRLALVEINFLGGFIATSHPCCGTGGVVPAMRIKRK